MAAHTNSGAAVHGIAAMLPGFPGSARPPAESPRRKALIHVVAVTAIVFSACYLLWRIGFTIDLEWWWIAIPLVLVEIHNALGLTLFTVALWDVDAGKRARPVDETDLRVAVLIPTYNEPEEVLLPTIAAAVALEPDHETWVLDDGQRDDVLALATELGARYLTRPSNTHAKAGNINHALGVIEADVIAVLDADHVPIAGFLKNTLGYFDDPDLALVQTPQDFYNLDSFEHVDRDEGTIFNEQAVFYRVIGPAKNRWNGAFWCGTSALVRVSALESVGGVATDTVTEDIHTTIRMQRVGWKTVYHNEVLARGLAAGNAIPYLVQRRRWAKGAMQVLRAENPVTESGLTFGQRLSYATTLWAWFDAWRSLSYVLLPIAVILTGAVPIAAPLPVFAALFLTTLLLQFVALRLLARGYYPPILSTLFEFLRMPAVLSGTLAILAPKRGGFEVTPKGRSGDERSRIPVPRLFWVLIAACIVAAVWFFATIAGATPLTYEVPGAAAGAMVFLTLNLYFLVTAIRRIRSARYAADRRASVRLTVSLHGRIDGAPCEIVDVSLTGAAVHVARPWNASASRSIGEILLAHDFVTQQQLDDAVRVQDHSDKPLGQILVESDAITRLELATALTEQWTSADEPAPWPLVGAQPKGKSHAGPIRLDIDFASECVSLEARIRHRAQSSEGGTDFGLEFLPGQRSAVSRVALALLSSEAAPRLERTPLARAA